LFNFLVIYAKSQPFAVGVRKH